MIVRVINAKSQCALIEWSEDGTLYRGTVPEEVIIDDAVRDDLLSIAIRYGLDWEHILADAMENVTPKIISNNLHKAGIWTVNDLRDNPMAALAALQATYGLDVSILLRSAETFVKSGGYDG
jgi:hypothetical protein